jgi:ribosomal protein S18 acetylase RimI-like enzyme
MNRQDLAPVLSAERRDPTSSTPWDFCWTEVRRFETLSGVDLRCAVAADLASIAGVHVRAWQETYGGQLGQGYLDGLSVDDRTRTWQEWTARAEWPNPDLLVLTDDDEAIVGFATTRSSHDPDAAASTAEVPAINTRQRVWGRGWGRALMAAAMARLRAAGCRHATLSVLETNDRARRFYEAAGWRWDGTTKPAVIGGQDVTQVRYRVELTAGGPG